MKSARHAGRARTLTLAALIVPALVVALFATQDAGTARAGDVCTDFKGELCLSLDPAEDTNPVGTDHTVTATLLGEGEPAPGVNILIIVAEGPNAGEDTIGVADENGQVSLAYTGSGGAGTDTIGALVCLDCGAGAEASLEDFAANCNASPEECAAYFEDCGTMPKATFEGGADPTTIGFTLCTSATKTWEEVEETPEVTPIPTNVIIGEPSIDVEVSDNDVEVGDDVEVTVTVFDENGDLVVGEECTFSIVGQPGDDASVEEGSTSTDQNGQATSTLGVGSTPGIVQVMADCGAFGTVVLDVAVSPAALPVTGAGESASDSGAWLSALLVAAGAIAVTGGLALRRRS